MIHGRGESGSRLRAPHVRGIETELGRDEIERALAREVRLGLAEAAVRADRARVRRDAAEVEADDAEVVRTLERADRDERGTDAGEVEHRVADVRGDVDAVGEDLAAVVVRGDDVVHLLARVDRRGEPLRAVLAPAHRTVGDQRERARPGTPHA